MNGARMERAGRRAKAGSLSGLSGGLPASAGGGGVRRQRSLEWAGDRYSSSDDDRPAHPPLADRVFASLLAQATQQFDDEQRRIYGSEGGEEKRYVSSPQRQASPFPLESVNRRYYRRNRNSKGEEIFSADAGGGGTLSRRSRRADEFTHENNSRNARLCLNNGTASGAQSERECESPPEPAPPEVPPRGPSLHVTLRHRPPPCDPPQEPDRLYLSEEFVMSEGGHGAAGAYPARSPMSSSTTGHSSSSHHRMYNMNEKWQRGVIVGLLAPGLYEVRALDGSSCRRHVDQLLRSRPPADTHTNARQYQNDNDTCSESDSVIIPPPEEWAEIIGI